MNLYSWFQLIFYILAMLTLAKPVGSFMAKVYQGEHTFLDRVLDPVERVILQRFQALLPLNPQGFGEITPDSSWNTAVSFCFEEMGQKGNGGVAKSRD